MFFFFFVICVLVFFFFVFFFLFVGTHGGIFKTRYSIEVKLDLLVHHFN